MIQILEVLKKTPKTDKQELEIKLSSKPLGFYSHSHDQNIRQGLKNLHEKPIIFHKKNQPDISFTLIKDYQYLAHLGQVVFKLEKKVVDLLTDVSHGYTSYSKEYAFSLDNADLLRMYWYICHFKKIKNIHISVPVARRILMLSSPCDPARAKENLSRRVLNYQRLLKQKCDLYYTITGKTKLGKELTGWNIAIKSDDHLQNDYLQNEPTYDPFVQNLKDTFRITHKEGMQIQFLLKSNPHKINPFEKACNLTEKFISKKKVQYPAHYFMKVMGNVFPELKNA